MKKPVLTVIIVLLLASCGFSSYDPDRILVKFKPGTVSLTSGTVLAAGNINSNSINILNSKYQAVKVEKAMPGARTPAVKVRSLYAGKTIEVPDMSQWYRITFPSGSSVETIVSDYRNDPSVSYAEPDYRVKAFIVPNDPGYALYQWDLAKIGMPDAWDVTTGEAASVLVGVVDTGVNYYHEDLAGKVVMGHNYINPATPNNPLDDNGHGTHIAGVIGAATNNNIGISGINWNARIYAIKVLDHDGYGSVSDTSAGITEATDAGAKVINLSLGDSNFSQAFADAVNYAYANGSLVIAAAGNEDTSNPVYPAALPNAYAVGATDQNDLRSVWGTGIASNYGAWVDICAPGTDIYSTWLGTDQYQFKDGTSMATPHVSGLASLLISRNPIWTPDQLRSRIDSTADNIDSLNPGFAGKLGAGRINATRAIGIPRAAITYPSSEGYIRGIVQVSGMADSIDFNSYTLWAGAGTSPYSYAPFYTGTTDVPEGPLGSFDTRNFSDGIKTIRLTVMNHEPFTVEARTVVIIDNTAPRAQITSPAAGGSAEGSVAVYGWATDANFNYYTLDYSKDGTGYININSSTAKVENDKLADWNTEGLSGNYILRLTAADRAGNQSVVTAEVQVNPSPTGSVFINGISMITPNPFNPAVQDRTYFSYNLTLNSAVSIYLYGINGGLIWQKQFNSGEEGGKAGLNLAPWNGRNLSGEPVDNGVYLYKICVQDGGNKRVLDSGRMIVFRN
ncbi:MAG TPA: S8 family serine peptidase [Candidatus Omnitrophota bacterium]|nr:S8 family serine peptidase [Candidatus Omnitrophota bacterium]